MNSTTIYIYTSRNMNKRRFRGTDFQEEYDIEFDNDDIIKERVLNSKFDKIYTLKDISRWVEYGIRNKLIKHNDTAGVMKWIDLLDGKHIKL